jgi:hypothetical protein
MAYAHEELGRETLNILVSITDSVGKLQVKASSRTVEEEKSSEDVCAGPPCNKIV